MEVLVEDLHEVVDGLQVDEVVVRDVHADAEVEPCVAAVHYLEVAELDEVGVFGVSYGHHSVYLKKGVFVCSSSFKKLT